MPEQNGTEADRVAALDELIDSGVKSVYSDGERVEYQSTGDLIKARQAAATRGKRAPRLRAFRLIPTMRV